ncbi:MAG: gluconokinase [Candidatus Rokubacteria bacterium]|nr:gluconokinase [Candidatus Rokubacteria bacterium]
MDSVLVALDVGSSSARAALFDVHGEALADRFHQVPYEPRVTADGGVEHDPAVLLDAVTQCLDAVHASTAGMEVLGVGLTTFWHGLLGFDRDGRPVTPLSMWADTRAAPEVEILRAALDEPALHARTGAHLHASYWPARLRWLAREHPALVARVARWGSFGEQLESELFGEAATSVSMASGTGLFAQQACEWDAEALAAAGITGAQLFPLVDRREPRRGLRRAWARRWPRFRTVAWFPAVGDGVASNVGSDCTDASRIALNVGTSAALRIVTPTPGAPVRGLWRYRIDRRVAIIGGATSEGGNVFAWCRDLLKLPDDNDAVERALAEMPPDGHGLTVLPFLAGERAPGWRNGRTAVIAGLTLDVTPVEVLQAAMEAVALRLAAVYAMLAPAAAPDHAVVASGGGLARSPAWRRMIVDALGHPVHYSAETEATSRGAALLALEALGVLDGIASPGRPLDAPLLPDPARQARYRAALERQRTLDERV